MQIPAQWKTPIIGALACLADVLVAGPVPDSNGWQQVTVPGRVAYAGTAWYRAWVKVPDSYFALHERNLFEDSVGLHIRDLAGAHEVWVNGTALTHADLSAPGVGEGSGVCRHKIPPGTLRQGQWNEITLQVEQADAAQPGGFGGDPPFIMDYFLECVLEGTWEFRLGGDYTPGSALAQRPAAAAFDHFRESSRVLARTPQVHGPSLSPEESVSRMHPGRDLAVDLLLHEPLIAQPTHFSFDSRGRLWMAQYRQYPYPAGLTMLSRDKYYRSHYDKIPPPPPGHDRGADIISIHEDTDGDGFFDRHRVFVDGLNMANAVVRDNSGVWVMQTPYLLRYPDQDGDDIPDGPPEVRLEGFGLEDSHSVANGLVWGPDGWLYGAQGSTTSCRVRRPNLDPPDAPGVYFEGCMVWRYHPRSRAFEIFSEGGGNTFGLAFDACGRLHSGHNGGGTRGWHFVQGGFYQMQGADPGKFGPPRNPYAFGELPMMQTTNEAVRFTHFGTFAEGTAMPSWSAGLLFSLDPLHNKILTSERHARGSTFSTVDRDLALGSEDTTFRPLYMANAPDGSLFVSDRCEFYIAHGQHYQNQIDPTTGRLYRLRDQNAQLERDVNLAVKSTGQLIALLSHPNKWHRDTAVRLLGERRDPEAAQPLRRLLAQDHGLAALNALWALYQSEGLSDDVARQGLSHSFAPIRLWTVRLLGDEWGVQRNLGVGRHGPPATSETPGTCPAPLFGALLNLAGTETDPEVLAQIASTARRLASAQAWPIVAAVLRHDEQASDPYIPLLCWWVFESHVPSDSAGALALLDSRDFWNEPIVFNDILPRLARRFALEGRHSDLLLCARLFRMAPSPAHAAQLMKGFTEAFRGRSMAALPDELAEAIAAAGDTPLVGRLKRGEPEAVKEALALLEDPNATAEQGSRIARAFGESPVPEAIAPLLAMVSRSAPASLQRDALVALMAYDEASIGRDVAQRLPELTGEAQIAAYSLLASRPAWQQALLNTLDSGRMPPSRVPEDVQRRLRQSQDPSVREAATNVWPLSPPTTRSSVAALHHIRSVLTSAPGNPYAGEAAFESRCAICHKLFFKGGNIGPDLTAYQRDNLDTMLPSIVDPNAEIREGYAYYTVETKDGRSLSGFFVERDNQVAVMRGLAGETITLETSQIKEVQPAGRSLMPEGLLDGMTDEELRDLFAYLRISQPITK